MIRAALLVFAASQASAESPLPFAMGGAYDLVNQHGEARTHVDPDGLPQLVFFGYSNCPGICSAALPMMADMTDAMAKRGVPVRPVMITVDPARDTVENIAGPLLELHSDFIGLTGSQPALDAAYKAFSVDHSLAYEDPEYGPVYSHGSLIYLLSPAGDILTIIPPVLDTPSASDIAWKYIKPQS